MSDEWEEKFSKEKNKPYWKNKTTGKSTWNDPTKAAAGITSPPVASPVVSPTPNDEWEEKFSKEKNKPYWKNKTTGKSTWTDPHASSTATAPTAAPAAAATPVSDEWEEKFSKEKNKPYWKNKVTGKSTWVNPTSAEKAATPATPAAAPAVADDDEWEEKLSKEKNKPYWKNKKTGKSSWTPPPPKAASSVTSPVTVPAAAADSEWEEKFSKEKNKPYWKSKVTGKSTWNDPHKGQPPPPPPVSVGTTGVKPPQPPPPPPQVTKNNDWEELFNKKKNKPYWKNKITGEMTWNDPNKNASASAAPIASTSTTTAASSTVTPTVVVEQTYEATNSTIRGVVWLLDSSSNVNRCLIELKGTLNDCVLQLCTVKNEKDDSLSSKPRSVDSIKMTDVKSITCNEVLGEIKLMRFLEGTGSSVSIIVLYFCNEVVAQQWFNMILLRINKQVTSDDSGEFTALDKTTNGSFKLSDEVSRLISKYQYARGSQALLAIESNWLLASSLYTVPLKNAEDTAVVTKCKTDLQKLEESKPLTVVNSDVELLSNSGLIVVKVLKDSKAGVEGWVSCWIKVDYSTKNIAFHDHGPGSAASFSVHCSEATLHTIELTDISVRELELYIQDCVVTTSEKSCMASLALMFQNTIEMWKWSRVFSQICKHFTCYNSSTLLYIPERLSHMMHDGRQFASPIRSQVPSLPSQTMEVALALVSAFAERNLVKSAIRSLKISGIDLKTARFVQVNQRVIVLMKGSNEEFTEGSVLLSINGLSAFTVPPATMLKFINDFPRQTVADITLWRFPRTEFHANVVGIETSFDGASGSSSNNVQANIQSMSGDQLAIDKLQSMFGVSVTPAGPKKENESTTKIEEVILRKRQSMLSVMAVSTVDAAEPDIAAIREQQAEQAKAAALKVAAKTLIPLNDFHRASLSEVKWNSCRVLIASGNITVVRNDEGSAGDVLVKIQVVNCQVSFMESKTNKTEDGIGANLYLQLKDDKSHAIICCPSLKILLSLAENVLMAMKLMGSYTSDLIVLYDQSEKWKRFVRTKSAPASSVVSSGQHRSSLLFQSIVAASGESSDMDTSLEATHPAADLVDPDGFEVDSTVLAAAEALEATLSDLKLPLAFPTVQTIESQVKEIYQLNLTNHRLWSKYLTLKYNVALPPDTTVSNKTAVISFMDGAVDEDSSANQEKIAALASIDNIIDTPSPAPTPKSRRMSRLSMAVDLNNAAKNNTPPPTSATAAARPIQQQLISSLLTSEDRRNLAVILRRLCSSPDDVMGIAKRVSSTISNLEKFSEIVVNRLFNHLSTDPASLESIIYKAALLDKKVVKPDLADIFTSNFEETSKPPKIDLGVDNESCFLGLLLREISHRVDVMAYLTHICQAVAVDTLTVECTVEDLMQRVVEPLCRYLQSLIMAGHIPDALMYALCALCKVPDCSISAMEMLAGCILPHLSNHILSKNKLARSQRKGGLSAEHCNMLIDRLKDLVRTCLDKEIGALLKLCFVDTAATTVASSVSASGSLGSPVARLAGLNNVTGKASALNGIICLRPSELIFLLESLDLNSITSSTLSASSKDLSDAVTYLQTSGMLNRLTSASLSHQQQGRAVVTPVNESMDRDMSFILQIDVQPAYPILDSIEDLLPTSSNTKFGEDRHDLLTPLLSAVDVDSQEVNDLANLQWLISASRSALKSIYEQQDLSKSQTVVKELTELRENLISKKSIVANCLMDLRKVELCKDLGANLKAQTHLLLDQVKNLKRKADSSQAASSTSANTALNGSMSSLQVMLSSSGSITDAPTALSANTPSDEEYNLALSKIIMLQLKLTGELCKKNSEPSTAPTTSTSTKSANSPGTGTATVKPRVQSTSVINDQLVAKAAVLSPSNKHNSTGNLHIHTGHPLANPRKANVGVNPLWNVMHKAFVVSSPKKSPVK